MKKTNDKKNVENEIKTIIQEIISNSRDAKWAKSLISKLTGLFKINKFVDVSLSDIISSIDFGACALHKVKNGYLLEAKGGMFTFVDNSMASVCAMLNTLFELNKPEKVQSEEDKELFDSFSSAVLYVFQGLIFSSLKDEMLFGVATDILTRFNAYCQENVDNAELHEETAEDIEKNIAFENMGRAMQNIADSPLPQAE